MALTSITQMGFLPFTYISMIRFEIQYREKF